MAMSICTPRCGPNAGSPLPGNNPPPAPGTGNGLPEGGNIGDIIINTGPGEGEWAPNPGGGEPGPAGKSAYEIAVEEGFVGTEAEWLESLVGAPGADGADGATGPMGADGPEGPEGPQGIQGIPGNDGPQGVQGNDGPEGPQGIPGVQGASLTIDEYGILDEAKVTQIETADVDWWFLVNPGGDDRVNNLLPAGIAGDMERHLIVYRASDNSWSDYGQFTGIQGPPGPQGAQGNPGVQGNPGIQGIQGEDGPAGATGAAGTPGISAYQVAVNNGFVGNEAAWLASLEGPQGPQGIQGIQGIQGPIGLTGATGAAGAAATTQPTFDMTLFNDVVVPAGIYPLTIYQPIAHTFTKFANRTAQGTIATVRILKNGSIAQTITLVNTTLSVDTINVPTVVGDILELELITVTGVRRADFALS